MWSLTDSERRAMGIERLPGSLSDAIRAMEGSELVAETLGEHVFDFFLRNKRDEWEEYRRQVTPFETLPVPAASLTKRRTRTGTGRTVERVDKRLLTAVTGAVAVAAVLTFAATRDDGGTAALEPVQPVTGVSVPSAPRSAAKPTPTPSPTAAETETAEPLRDEPAAPPPGDYEGRPATADPARPPGSALPTGCLSFSHACGYDGATGAVTGGVSDFAGRRTGADSVRLTWRSENLAGDFAGGPVTEFVVSAYRLPYSHQTGPRDATRLRRVRVPATTFSYTFTGLLAGQSYDVWVQELNSSGLSSGMGVYTVTMPSPSPSATAPPTPTPTATVAPTATTSPSATP